MLQKACLIYNILERNVNDPEEAEIYVMLSIYGINFFSNTTLSSSCSRLYISVYITPSHFFTLTSEKDLLALALTVNLTDLCKLNIRNFTIGKYAQLTTCTTVTIMCYCSTEAIKILTSIFRLHGKPWMATSLS